jgi:hypothetical protein
MIGRSRRHLSPRRTGVICALVGAVALSACGSSSAPKTAAVRPGKVGIYQAVSTFSGPITVGHVIEPLTALPLDLAQNGYVQQEFFASGMAHAFRATSSPSDGRWAILPTTSATYRTRILVRRPSSPARFSGTLVVEWLNESAGESAPDWDFLNPALMDAGDAWVGVSAQAVGIEGGKPILGSISGSGRGLIQQEPRRYGSLHHPGDQYALDIFDQVGLGLRSTKPAVLGSLRPRYVVAVGESQSAFYLTTFADTLQPLSRAFDGIFIHSRGGSGAPLSGASITSGGGVQGGLRIRTDLDVPVFMFETQTDLIELGYAAAAQPDTPDIRTWEVAGTSHADSYLLGSAASLLGCTTPINDGPQHVVVQAAFADFVQWVTHGTPPPSPLPFKLSSVHPARLALDRYGNVVGGVRTPAVDVPVSTLSGAAPSGTSLICSLFGSAKAFSDGMLADLYGTKAHYLAEYTADLDLAISGRYILASDRDSLLAKAEQVRFL